MKKELIISLSILSLIACGSPSNKPSEFTNDNAVADSTIGNDYSNEESIDEGSHIKSSEDYNIYSDKDYRQGSLDGATDGTEDGVNRNAFNYHFKSKSSIYREAYCKMYDEAYKMGRQSRDQAERDSKREADRIRRESGI